MELFFSNILFSFINRSASFHFFFNSYASAVEAQYSNVLTLSRACVRIHSSTPPHLRGRVAFTKPPGIITPRALLLGRNPPERLELETSPSSGKLPPSNLKETWWPTELAQLVYNRLNRSEVI